MAWHFESERHGLARKGIKTGHFSRKHKQKLKKISAVEKRLKERLKKLKQMKKTNRVPKRVLKGIEKEINLKEINKLAKQIGGKTFKTKKDFKNFLKEGKKRRELESQRKFEELKKVL